jgi:hypothetical protein
MLIFLRRALLVEERGAVHPSRLNGAGDRENKIRWGGRGWHLTRDASYFDDCERL